MVDKRFWDWPYVTPHYGIHLLDKEDYKLTDHLEFVVIDPPVHSHLIFIQKEFMTPRIHTHTLSHLPSVILLEVQLAADKYNKSLAESSGISLPPRLARLYPLCYLQHHRLDFDNLLKS
ncbi:hypothetical protein ACTXT7_007985 [Hymenolepis weldensis]